MIRCFTRVNFIKRKYCEPVSQTHADNANEVNRYTKVRDEHQLLHEPEIAQKEHYNEHPGLESCRQKIPKELETPENWTKDTPEGALKCCCLSRSSTQCSPSWNSSRQTPQ